MGGSSKKIRATEYEKELSRIALKEYQLHRDKLAPFRDRFIEDVTGPTRALEQRLAGEVGADFAQMGRQAIQGDPSLGVNRSAIMPNQMGDLQARAAVSATQQGRDMPYKGMIAGIRQTQGLATDAMQGTAGLAGQSVKDAIDRRMTSIENKDVAASSLGSAVGAGASLYYNRNK